MNIDSPTARLEQIALGAEEQLDAMPQGFRRNRLVRALANVDQKIAAGKQGMLLDYRKVTDE